MAKATSKRYWIVYENNDKVVKHLSWKDSSNTKTKLATKFYWNNEDQAERYLRYMNGNKEL